MEKINTSFKTFALTVIYAFGAIGGVLCTALTGYWFIALGVASVAAMAFPFVRKQWTDGE